MNLLFAKILGKFWSTDKLETYLQRVTNDVSVYHNFPNSPIYPKYIELQTLLTSKEFLTRKHQIQDKKYKDTAEYKKMREYKRLSSSLAIKIYLYLLQKENVQAYLKKQQEGGDMSTPKSFTLKLFISYYQSQKVIRYLGLKEEVNGEDFKQKNAFWSNPKRWNLTEEAKKEAEFAALCSQEEIKNYRKINKKEVQFYDKFEIKVDEHYRTDTIEDTIWRGGFFYEGDVLKKYHSYADQYQAFNDGKNISLRNNVLTIHFRREDREQIAWTDKGFLLHPYPYTSDIINTGKTITMHKGMMLVMKMRANGDMHHLVSLCPMQSTSPNHNQQIQLFHTYKNKLEMGICNGKEKKLTTIRGINPNEWYYYVLVWNDNGIILYINNFVVVRYKLSSKEEYYIQAVSFLHKDVRKKEVAPRDLSGDLQIAYTGIYALSENIPGYIYNMR